jgi:P4 family phage/plasmid primase-like protien
LPSYFPIKNGKKICLKTLKVTERTENDYFTFESQVEFIQGETPNADKFFGQLMQNEQNREFLRKVLGYGLTGETCARKFFIFYGKGSNGKSKLCKLLEKILNIQYTQCDQSIFMKSKRSGGSATPELMALLGKRLGVYSEGETADNIEMNQSGLKQISGEDKITGRSLYSSQVEFYPYIKLYMLTNFTPPLTGDFSIVERLIYIFLDSQFVDNPKSPNEFKIDREFSTKLEKEYLSEIFTWIVKGSKVFYDDLKIEMTDEFKQRTKRILQNEDSIETYFERVIKITNNQKDVIKKTDFFENYKMFCNLNSQRCLARSSFFQRLSQKNINLHDKPLHGCDVYRGVKVLSENEMDEKQSSPLDSGLKSNEIIEKLENKNELLMKQLNDANKEIEDLKNKLKEKNVEPTTQIIDKQREMYNEFQKDYDKMCLKSKSGKNIIIDSDYDDDSDDDYDIKEPNLVLDDSELKEPNHIIGEIIEPKKKKITKKTTKRKNTNNITNNKVKDEDCKYTKEEVDVFRNNSINLREDDLEDLLGHFKREDDLEDL